MRPAKRVSFCPDAMHFAIGNKCNLGRKGESGSVALRSQPPNKTLKSQHTSSELRELCWRHFAVSSLYSGIGSTIHLAGGCHPSVLSRSEGYNENPYTCLGR